MVIRDLENRISTLLKREEMEWRLNSQALWVALGDNNTPFFHNFAYGRRNHNAIWELCHRDGNMIKSQEGIQDLEKNHLSNHFKDFSI